MWNHYGERGPGALRPTCPFDELNQDRLMTNGNVYVAEVTYLQKWRKFLKFGISQKVMACITPA